MSQSLLHRLFIYQKERFPLLVHMPLIAAFSFSVIGYSRACRHATGFIHLTDYLACITTNIVMFFMLRVSDEYKDKEDDALYRRYLPVPRGLVTLKELSSFAWPLFIIITILNIVGYAGLLPLFAIMMFYLLLMRYEFFAGHWLKKHQVLYIASHMVIIPLADMYASGYDWRLDHVSPPQGLLFFFGVSFFNGIILEVGRKLRAPGEEEIGVLSYTRLWGLKGAGLVWLALLVVNFILARIAAYKAAALPGVAVTLNSLFLIALLPLVWFLVRPNKRATAFIKLISFIWALGMYIALGSIPLLAQLNK